MNQELEKTQTPTSESLENKFKFMYPYGDQSIDETPNGGIRTLEEFKWVVREPFATKLFEIFTDVKRKYLEYEHDWDGEGAHPFADEIFDRVEEFLIVFYGKHVENNLKLENPWILNIPKIYPVSDGSVDLLWRFKDKLDLMINISNSQPNEDIITTGFIPCKLNDNGIISMTKMFTLEEDIIKSVPVIIKWLTNVIQ